MDTACWFIWQKRQDLVISKGVPPERIHYLPNRVNLSVINGIKGLLKQILYALAQADPFPVVLHVCEDLSEYYRELAVQGSYAYIAGNNNGLVVLNISNPAVPSYAGEYNSSVFNGYLQVSVSGNYACVMNMEYDIEILDISNLSSISEVGKYTSGALANDFVLIGNYLYVAEGSNGLKIIDISNPASPVVAGYYKPAFPDPISVTVFVSGQDVYVADVKYGLMIIRFTP